MGERRKKPPIVRFEEYEDIRTPITLPEVEEPSPQVLALAQPDGSLVQVHFPDDALAGLAVFSTRRHAHWFRRLHGLHRAQVVTVTIAKAQAIARRQFLDGEVLLADNPICPIPLRRNSAFPRVARDPAIPVRKNEAFTRFRETDEEPRVTFEVNEEIISGDLGHLLGKPFPERGLRAVAWNDRYAVIEMVDDELFALAVFTKKKKAETFAQSKPKATDGRRPRSVPAATERMTLDEARLTARVAGLAALVLLDDPQHPVYHWVR